MSISCTMHIAHTQVTAVGDFSFVFMCRVCSPTISQDQFQIRLKSHLTCSSVPTQHIDTSVQKVIYLPDIWLHIWLFLHMTVFALSCQCGQFFYGLSSGANGSSQFWVKMALFAKMQNTSWAKTRKSTRSITPPVDAGFLHEDPTRCLVRAF